MGLLLEEKLNASIRLLFLLNLRCMSLFNLVDLSLNLILNVITVHYRKKPYDSRISLFVSALTLLLVVFEVCSFLSASNNSPKGNPTHIDPFSVRAYTKTVIRRVLRTECDDTGKVVVHMTKSIMKVLACIFGDEIKESLSPIHELDMLGQIE